ncbi:NAD(P)H-quinone oxidoreductase subunit F [Synechocystis sp. FACHB-898]|uniref:NAD(P)H-quinone oxidoreductase subunit F n=1 Tax=unclassified Synechocystis TaxID=2640012 RepID=UPI0016868167|nr:MULTISPECIES: NAD(P)H-quinone oxidoreductase subunit F [unclassified Synechocystis]MBD2618664.1 NAD(P)H-quinone oxidoreductase subunit F [Synechocystis sp. FACHB-898]MBD2640015.1 NAD(P)H-quinone oxidoreductase subunit F [Synechocystis sp. FACHB-908]MBD2661138.1 NAD(P)H-quinone oxidoreductase subunit F [Synechocystis sp. FACHB-929]
MLESLSRIIWLVPCYALLGALLAVPWSPGLTRQTGPRPAGYISTLMTFVAFLHSLLVLIHIWQQPAIDLSFPWLHAADLEINFDLKISTVNIAALVLITGLNLGAQIYAIGYLERDWGWARFFSLMALFEAGLCTLVLCNSLFFSYVVLEILTLGTYLLIGYWFNQSLVVTGARDAFLTKRVGDLILLMGVVALLPLAGSWNYDDLAQWAASADLNPTAATLLCLALIAGPLAKCAQFPLHLWLDEAMEGPIPATILRNTLVVATGAWVLVKVQPILALSPVALTVMIAIGSVTAIGASLIAIAQIDIKRFLSYVVSAYMGLVFIAVGTGQGETALQLIFTYTFAMAILVMCVWGIILNNVTQDLTQYGGLWSRRPISGLSYLVGVASLIALPPFGTFWAWLKLAENLSATSPLLVGVLLVVNLLTAFNVTRGFCLIFGGEAKPMTVRSPEGLWALVLPMVVTVGFALHLSLILKQGNLLPDFADINWGLSSVLIASSLLGVGSSAFIYLNPKITKPIDLPLPVVQNFFAYDLYTDKFYKLTIVAVIDSISRLINWFDKTFVDGVINLIGIVTIFSGQSLKYNVSGQTQFYVLSIVLGLTLIGAFLSYSLLGQAF